MDRRHDLRAQIAGALYDSDFWRRGRGPLEAAPPHVQRDYLRNADDVLAALRRQPVDDLVAQLHADRRPHVDLVR